MVIGIIGKICSGKSIVTEHIKVKYGAEIFILDDIFKYMRENNLIKNDFDTSDIFENEIVEQECREILHPQVFDYIFNKINKNDGKVHIIETALPNEDFIHFCDKTIYIKTNEKEQIKRYQKNRRDDIMKVNKILKLQEFYTKFYEKADYILQNDGNIEDLYKKVDGVMDEICVIRK